MSFVRASAVTPAILRQRSPATRPAGTSRSLVSLHTSAGNQAMGRAIQAKLRISQAGDQYEAEADRVADQVMRMPEPAVQRTCACGGTCDDCQEEEDAHVQRATTSAAPGPASLNADAHASVANVLGSRGEPLDPATRAFMEPRLGTDLGAVQIHRDDRAAESARDVQALAYTVGRDVVFAPGQYAPHTSTGRRLIAHELVHTLQQRAVATPGHNANRAMDATLRGKPISSAPLGLYRQSAGPSSRVRFPTLEVFSARSGAALATGGVPLSASDRTDAAAIFGSSIDLDVVRIVRSPVAATPTTLGNYIRVHPGHAMPRWELIHELTHVWQYQTKGTAYISDSAWHQFKGMLFSGSRHAAGTLTIEPGKSIHAYQAEQQAVIVTWFYQDPSLASDPEFARMIAEVQAGRPLPASLILEEAAWGSGMGTERLRSSMGAIPETFTSGPGVPLIRWEF